MQACMAASCAAPRSGESIKRWLPRWSSRPLASQRRASATPAVTRVEAAAATFSRRATPRALARTPLWRPTRIASHKLHCRAASGKIAVETPMRTQYTTQKQLESGKLKVSDVHTLHYEVYGNPDGAPAIVVHGGPGAGCFTRHGKFFDPAHYKIVLLDQRGCGRSTPLGCLEDNTTQALVGDMEALRAHLGIEKWLLFGGSWGVTLALAYAQTHPECTSAILLRGICLMRRCEIDWAYRGGGANALAPRGWEAFVKAAVGCTPAEAEERGLDLVAEMHAKMTGNDAAARDRAASAWHSWGFTVTSVGQAVASDGVKTYDGRGNWSVTPRSSVQPYARRETSAVPTGAPATTAAAAAAEDGEASAAEATSSVLSELPKVASTSTAQAMLECHYCMHGAWLEETPLLAGIEQIRHIPCVAVHGAMDFICPVRTAWDLHSAWPEAEIRLVGGAGHSMYDPAISHELLVATDYFKQIVPMCLKEKPRRRDGPM